MNKKVSEIMKKHTAIIIESIIGIITVVFLIYTMRSMLLFGKTTIIHDNILGAYPSFQFFAENIINGHFPFWNPFNHGGEPFYPLLGQTRLLEPITLLTIYLGQFINNDIVMLFNWNRFVQGIVMSFGAYIVFRPLAKHLFIRLSLMPILLYSSFTLILFRQDSVFYQFAWTPFITYFLLRIVYYKDYRWHNWLALAGLIGLNWQSYFFAGAWVFLLFFSLGIVLFHRDWMAELFKDRMLTRKLAVAVVIIFTMAAPDIALMLEEDKYVFPTRMIDTSYGKAQGSPQLYEGGGSFTQVSAIDMPYALVAFSGTFSSIWDFIQVISPDGNRFIKWRNRSRWGTASEAYMYLGFLPWAIAVLGLVAGRHDMKRLWLFMLICFGLLMLGPSGGLHRLLYYIYPPMWFVRHTHAFVLFFIFALLYFYVLGFNHLFSTWGGPLFHPDTSQGILGHLIKWEKVRRSIAILIFSACIVIFVYWMTKKPCPTTDSLLGFIAPIFAVGWFLRKDLGEKGLYVSLIGSHIVIVLILSTNTSEFILYILSALGFPLALFMFVRSGKGLSEGLLHYSPLILLFVFGTALTMDLIYSLRKSSFLYGAVKHIGDMLTTNTTPQKPFLPRKRFVYPRGILRSKYVVYLEHQEIRYLPLIYRESFVFSPIMLPVGPDSFGSYVQVEAIFNGLANKSFEDWVTSPNGGNSLPEQFTYHQDGSGGAIERYTGDDGVKDGKASVLLKPSSVGDSYMRYETSKIEELRGKCVRASAWVKSQNKSRDAIQIYIHDDGTGPSPPSTLKFYNNSGDWEHLVVGKDISSNATNLFITCNIKSSATMPVFFDGPLIVETVTVNKDAFEYALKSKRWSSLFFLKRYFELINMDIPAWILEKMFAVGEPIFQFKQGVVLVKESEIPSLFRDLGTINSSKLLQESVIVDEQVEPSLVKLKVSAEEYGKTTPAVATVGTPGDTGSTSGVKEKRRFKYTIGRYRHDSFDMKVFTEDDGILYWADGYDKNWHAYVNGKEVPIYRANINFKAISLPKGTNNISFIYDPFLFKIGLFVFYGTFVCTLAVLVIRGLYFIAQTWKTSKSG